MRPPVKFVLLLITSLLAACETANDVQVHAAPVVYGDDDRVEVFAHPDPTMRALAIESTMALLPGQRLSNQGDGTFALNAPTLQENQDLCPGELFASQPSAARCSGVLIDDDLLLTAGHCIRSQAQCTSLFYVFDYRYESEGVLAVIDSADVYTCQRLVIQELNTQGGLTPDFAIVQLDRPVAEARAPAPLRETEMNDADPITMIGFGTGLPAKIDSGGFVLDARTDTLDFFDVNADAFAGHSGSPVFDANGLLAGILVAGREPDYVFSSKDGCNRANVFDESEGQEAVHYISPIIEGLCVSGWPSERLCDLTPCVGDDCPPAAWTCSDASYDDGANCDCRCGALDPDCNDASLPIRGCIPGQWCSVDNECTSTTFTLRGGTCGVLASNQDSLGSSIVLLASLFALVIRRRRRY